jgi:hypothetical protein
MLCWKAGYSDEMYVRFGGRLAETCLSDGKTRRHSTLYQICTKREEGEATHNIQTFEIYLPQVIDIFRVREFQK